MPSNTLWRGKAGFKAALGLQGRHVNWVPMEGKMSNDWSLQVAAAGGPDAGTNLVPSNSRPAKCI